MFTDASNEIWVSTKNQDAFIKNYFGEENVRSIKEEELNFDILQDLPISYMIQKMRMMKKKRKKNEIESEDNDGEFSEQTTNCDELPDNSIGTLQNVQMRYSPNSESNSVKSKEKKRKKNQIESEDFFDGEFSEQTTNCDELPDNSISTLQNVKMKYSPNSESNCVESKKKKKKKSKSGNIHNFEDPTDMMKDSEPDCLKIKISKIKSNSVEEYLEKTEDVEEESTNTSRMSLCSENKKSNLFQNKLYQKLQAAKFRYLNEMLYTNTGKDALSHFMQNTDEFEDYHKGFQSQVAKWPINPVNIIIEEINQMEKEAVIADLGCGEAKIAKIFPNRTVHSFDLIAVEDCVTACDMANVPLPSKSVDVAVFCLSLMGTNWRDYVKECHRLLKSGGVLKIAEIESRIENLDHFVKNIESYKFSLINKNISHKMFVFLNFRKVKKNKKTAKVPDVTLKPCLYKKR